MTKNVSRASKTTKNQYQEFEILLSMHLLLLLQITPYRQTSNISRSWVPNKLADHSDVDVVSHVGDAPTNSSFLDLTTGFLRLKKVNCKKRRETFKFLDLVRLILDIWRYFTYMWLHTIIFYFYGHRLRHLANMWNTFELLCRNFFSWKLRKSRRLIINIKQVW